MGSQGRSSNIECSLLFLVFGLLIGYLLLIDELLLIWPYRVVLEPPSDVLKASPALDLALEYAYDLPGPESFVEGEDGSIYTGVADGRVVRLPKGDAGHPETIVRIGEGTAESCNTDAAELVCGRPLGMAFFSRDILIVCDATFGLMEIDVVQKTKRLLTNSVDGTPIRFCNSVAVSGEGVIYFTDSSTRHLRNRVFRELIDGYPSGRLLSYYNGKTTLLKDKIGFANGLALSHDGTHLIVAELFRSRVLIHYLTGPQKGDTHPLGESLPFMPDNIHPHPFRPTYLVGSSMDRSPVVDWMMTSRVARLIMSAIPYTLVDHLSGKGWYGRQPYTVIYELDENAAVVGSYRERLHAGRITYCSDGFLSKNGDLYVGSFQRFIPLWKVHAANMNSTWAKEPISVSN